MVMAIINKRGQSAAGAAVLLAIIAGLLIMFIILIPPQDRAELLGEQSSGGTSGSSSGTISNYMSVSPGKIDHLAKDEIEHNIPSVTVHTDIESKILAEKNIAYAKRGLFSNNPSVLKFSVPDLANTQSVYLNFNVEAISDKLIVSVNGEQVYNDEAKAGDSLTIMVPKNILINDNEISFTASSPKFVFWATNEISLSNIKVVVDATNLEGQMAKSTFLISEEEKSNLEKVVLKFQPDCKYGEAGRLHVYLNGEEVYSGFPDCDLAMVPIDISASKVNTEGNELMFKVDKSTYFLSHIVLLSKLKEIDYPTYYFQLSEEKYNNIVNSSYKVRVKMSFVDVDARKYGDLTINGHVIPFDTKAITYTADVTDYVVRGANAVKIKPGKTLEVRELRVDLLK
jgi:hypothetical protein